MKRIIFVEDDLDLLDSIKFIFDPAEYELLFYTNGNAILENKAEIPDLYILDKQLSGVDGLDICRFLKTHNNTSHIPIIIFSASPDIKRLAIEAGANDSLEKPFSITALRNMVQQLLGK